MIEVRIPIPLDEYLHVKIDLEVDFDRHGIVCILSADTVIRTWAGLMFHDWFDKQDEPVDYYIGWGELGVEYQDEPMLAAASADMVGEGYQPRIVMIFEEDGSESPDYTDEDADRAKNLAIMFKLAWGGGA